MSSHTQGDISHPRQIEICDVNFLLFSSFSLQLSSSTNALLATSFVFTFVHITRTCAQARFLQFVPGLNGLVFFVFFGTKVVFSVVCRFPPDPRGTDRFCPPDRWLLSVLCARTKKRTITNVVGVRKRTLFLLLICCCWRQQLRAHDMKEA